MYFPTSISPEIRFQDNVVLGYVGSSSHWERPSFPAMSQLQNNLDNECTIAISLFKRQEKTQTIFTLCTHIHRRFKNNYKERVEKCCNYGRPYDRLNLALVWRSISKPSLMGRERERNQMAFLFLTYLTVQIYSQELEKLRQQYPLLKQEHKIHLGLNQMMLL